MQVNDADELAGLDEEGDFDLGDVLAGIRGKAARAVIQRDMKRKQQARAASLAWQRYEVGSVAHDAPHQSVSTVNRSLMFDTCCKC